MRFLNAIFIFSVVLCLLLAAETLGKPGLKQLVKVGISLQLSLGISDFSPMPALADSSPDPWVVAEEKAMNDPTNRRAQIIKASNNWLADSSFLENIRLHTQANTDVTAESKDADVNLYLIPIAKLDLELKETKATLTKAKEIGGTASQELLKKASGLLAPYDVKLLKATFNRYSDNIFYTDKRAANLYLAGGATPGTLQTQAYLYRNSIITNIGNCQQDLKEMIGTGLEDKTREERSIVFDDTLDDLREASDAMNAYLQLVEPGNLSKATAAARTSLSF